MKKAIVERRPDEVDSDSLNDLHPVLRRIYLARNIRSKEELNRSLANLPDPWLLSGMEIMVQQLIGAIQEQKKILIVADFDADGATSCTIAKLGLQMLGAKFVSYVVPNRFKFGYGLTPEIVEVASGQSPDIIVTVDNGISSIDGVEAARERGLKVLITDHHLPGEKIPLADAIVNPNMPGDQFPSKNLAGVGVMFYILMALRTRLRESGWFSTSGIKQPNLAQLLDFVALGTVADVVNLDFTNRVLVHQGLQRIRSGQGHPGIMAILDVARRSFQSLTSSDLGYAIAPRLNAAGRLQDMSLGIECLLSEHVEHAKQLAIKLDKLNKERREIEDRMKGEALLILKEMENLDDACSHSGICLFDANWHPGVVGILASRIKERVHRPVIAFAPADEGEVKGSARSIPGVHIRDVLSEVATHHPQLLTKFGGHAMAAGMSLKSADFDAFSGAFDKVVRRYLEDVDLEQKVYTDGQLDDQWLILDFAQQLQNAGPWGQGFPEPVFDGEFDVLQVRIVGEKHVKFVLKLATNNRTIDAIAFFVENPDGWLGCIKARFAYRLDVNEFRDIRSAQLVIEHMENRSGN